MEGNENEYKLSSDHAIEWRPRAATGFLEMQAFKMLARKNSNRGTGAPAGSRMTAARHKFVKG